MFSIFLLRKVQIPLLGAALLVTVPSTQAAMVLSYETTNQGGVNVTAGGGAGTLLFAPGSISYGNTLGTGLANLVPPPAGVANYNFYDDYIINIPTSSLNSISSTIDFGDLLRVSNLQVRLYGGSTPSLSPGGVIDGWSTPLTSGTQTGIVSVLPATLLSAGDYILEVRGLADGEFGGSYSGVLNVAPVPVPAAVWLLLSGLVVVGGLSRMRESAETPTMLLAV
jgi:hypothetical protein